MKIFIDIKLLELVWPALGVLFFVILSMVYRTTESWQYTLVAGAGCATTALIARMILRKKHPKSF